MNRPLLKISTIVLIFCSIISKSQSIDSLVNALKTQGNDTSQYNLLAKIARAYSDSNYSLSLQFWQKAIEVSRKIKQPKLIADSHHQIGYSYQKMGEFRLALDNLSKASEIYNEVDEQEDFAGTLNDIGLIYRNWNKYDEALVSYFRALKIFDEIPDAEGSAMVSNNIGQIYFYRENYTKAINYFERYLSVNEQLKNHRAVAGAANNIASANMELSEYDKALRYYLKALRIYDSLGVHIGVAIIRDNIGSLFYQKQQYDNALLYHHKALKTFELLNSPTRICYTLKNIAMVYLEQKKTKISIENLNKSLNLAKRIGQNEIETDLYQILAKANKQDGNYKLAYNYLEEYIAKKDSIQNTESLSKLEQLQAEYEMQRNENEKISAKNRKKNQEILLYGLIGFTSVLMILLFLLYKENRAKNDALRQLSTKTGNLSKE